MDTRPATDPSIDNVTKSSTAHILFRLESSKLKSTNDSFRSLITKNIQGNAITEIPQDKIEALSTTLDGINASLSKLRATLAEPKTPASIKQALNARVDALILETQKTASSRETLQTLVRELHQQAGERETIIKNDFQSPTDVAKIKHNIEEQNKVIAEKAKAVAAALRLFEGNMKQAVGSYTDLRNIAPSTETISLPPVEKLLEHSGLKPA